MKKLENKRCLITGAARGIGQAIATAFSEAGAEVILTDKNIQAGSLLAQQLGCIFEPLDVRLEADWDRIAFTYPDMDVVVNNVGITGFEEEAHPHDPEQASLEHWRAVHAVNLDGVFLGCRYAIRAMRPSGRGSIINISSRSGMVGIPLAAAYASSKAAVRNHSKSVALYCAQQGLDIRCNSIHPGAILTPMWEAMLGEGEEREKNLRTFTKDVPAGRFGQPEEVAALALLLASDDACYMTGAELTLDGGLLAGTAASPG
ncbi:SDR family oxidoreductase [Aestuariispira insulae]|uniref:NAD(P)-dependent dehydrogenase (Short-subunit alcohol dehydrogenase family) n=1 Tax=Aestuariispira insulae TaxID=1461337 RepID=A0A3D9HWN4_9PROT|nr:SDR family oxidoreductase [Aestuariispira insulae]RED53825.1 NAD(P)-dependent dehydrogenase (short-subunit alcohol dehydrogenase family) [Aestuariispira insulae]